MMDQPQPGVAQGMGIDPALCEQLIAEASQLQADGQRKMSISEELFAQIQGAMQNFYAQKQQVQQEDIATAMNAQQLGALAGRTLFELSFGPRTNKKRRQEDDRVRRAQMKKYPKDPAYSNNDDGSRYKGDWNDFESRIVDRIELADGAALGKAMYKKYGGITRTASKVGTLGIVGGVGYLAGKRRQKKLQQQQQQPQQPQQPQNLGALAGRTLFELGYRGLNKERLTYLNDQLDGVLEFTEKRDAKTAKMVAKKQAKIAGYMAKKGDNKQEAEARWARRQLGTSGYWLGPWGMMGNLGRQKRIAEYQSRKGNG